MTATSHGNRCQAKASHKSSVFFSLSWMPFILHHRIGMHEYGKPSCTYRTPIRRIACHFSQSLESFEEYAMPELNELRLNDNRMLLKDHVVRSPILPKTAHELERDVVVQGDCEVEGAVFARNLEVQSGSLHIKGCVYTCL